TQAGAAASKVVISANPAGLTPGFYAGLVTITNLADTSSSSVQVGLTVGAASGTILTTSSSFVFYTVQGSNYVPAQFTRILNTGQGTMSWQVQSSVSEGDWLRVSPASGISDAANAAGAPVVTVSVDPTGLLPGVYGGYVSIQSAGARNTPQLASVTLRVLPPGSPPLAQVQPAGLLFTAITNSSPQSQQVTVQTTGGGTLTYSVGTRTQDGSGWLTASPTAGSVTSSTDRPQIRVQAVPGTLLPRVYRGSVTVSFSDGTASEIAVAMIVREPDVVPQGFGEKQAGCAPNQQVILSLRLGNNFSIPTGWPATVVAAVTSNCGTPVNNSTVAVSFSNGDGTIILNNQGDGVYSKDWVPSNASGPDSTVQVTMRALHPALPESSLQLVGRLSADATNNPFVNDNGVVNGASFVPNRPVSPGSIVSIYGSNLASAGPCLGGSCATSLPLPTSLGGVSVRIGGQNAPLFYAGPAQIYAQIPAELSGVTSADVVVTSRGVVSAPRAIQLDANQPGIFVAGGTQGAVLNQNSSTNSAFNPAARGSVLRIFATGLGPTNPPVTTGTPAPTSPPLAALVTPVTVTIGGVNAPVQFQALAPGYVGLYRVDVQVPSNVTPGSAVPLKFTQNGVESNQVTVAIN
ncbi:MAG: hypothetical protein HYX73_07555, partial [Acidobacteria bacterium]|nr:hypothetical protein [Acidobacteriota bacterium]